MIVSAGFAGGEFSAASAGGGEYSGETGVVAPTMLWTPMPETSDLGRAGRAGAVEGLTTVSTVQVEVISIPGLITGGG
ncbi:hypothetical protein Franean1_2667 [Parafrankia sp. EAN1pec]|uniref:hypothetical protein n=1 Tax=Parafrankia sp. (strain EAN1pec) TaxID=298653 RepID=UPI00015D9E68|nr:hypothetical protein Franean1_2667 [Frankia sp. EAN1pec]